MNLKRRTNLIITIVILSIFVSATGCSTSPSQEADATPTPIPTAIIPTKPTYTVERGSVIEELQFTARVAPVVEEELFFRTAGRVRNIYVEEGDEVEEGQIIADLEFLDDLERQLASDQLRLRRSDISVENAQLALDLFKKNTPSSELLLAQAEKAVADAEEHVSKASRALSLTQLTANQADIDAAYAQVVLTEEALERAKERFAPYANKPENNITRARLQADLSAAEQRYESAVIQYNAMTGTASETEQGVAFAELAVAKAQLADAQAELERIQENPVPRGYEEELALKENELELAKIAYDETLVSVADVESAISDAQLVAPFDGVVTSLRISDGSAAEAFRSYSVVSDMSSLELSASLTSEDMQYLEKGMPVTANLSSRPSDIYAGIIRYLPYGLPVEEIEEEQTTRISLDVDTEELGLDLGDLMRVTVILEKKDDVLWLPPQAIRTFEGRKFVVLQADGYQQRVDVTVGIEGDDRVEIESGLEEGQIIISP
ncbi:MAG: efflux RND transporter periplasmic adaptor subunit [Anaerolineales bacterium]|jgi:multidrug efflux pump subunit AcrA (membrane-fusion protein)